MSQEFRGQKPVDGQPSDPDLEAIMREILKGKQRESLLGKVSATIGRTAGRVAGTTVNFFRTRAERPPVTEADAEGDLWHHPQDD